MYFWLCWVFIAEWALPSCSKWGLLPSYSARASHCGGFSGCRAQALGAGASVVAVCGSVVAAPRLSSTSSAVVAQGLSCYAACGIFWDQGSNRDFCIGRQILYHGTTREALSSL